MSAARRPLLRQRQLIIDAALLGVAGAAAAQVFTLLLQGATGLFLGVIAGYQPPGLPNEGGVLAEVIGRHGLWLVPVVTTLGGLLVGVLVQRLAPETEGHGTDTVVHAFHRTEGVLRPRVTPIKLVASALTIGSGGSAGREGPIALAAAGVGSWYAQLTNRPAADRRLLVVVGMAAGIAAIFRSPIGAALFAIEVLYLDMEFESAALLPALLASVIAYALNGFFVGWQPLFRVPTQLTLPRLIDNGWYLALGVAGGVVAAIVPLVFYGMRDLFRRLPVSNELKPAIGGLGMGLLALAWPGIIAGGYGWMQLAINGQLAAGALLALLVVKPVAMSLTISSGGSGGVFAPTLFIGGMLGGLLATAAHLPAAPLVIVGMAAVFSGAAHVPIASLMMVTEMTGGYTLLVPASLAVLVSYLVQRRLTSRQRYHGLYEAQVAGRADSPAHHSEHLKIALRLLQERKVLDPSDIGQVDLLALLRSGIPIELPGGQRLMIGVVRPDSSWRDRTLAETSADGTTRVFAIIRGEHMMVPRPEATFQAGDRVLLMTSAEGLERLSAQLEKW